MKKYVEALVVKSVRDPKSYCCIVAIDAKKWDSYGDLEDYLYEKHPSLVNLQYALGGLHKPDALLGEYEKFKHVEDVRKYIRSGDPLNLYVYRDVDSGGLSYIAIIEHTQEES